MTFKNDAPGHLYRFHRDHSDAAECRRLRLALGLNADKMAVVAGMPGRWAWMSVEAGYEPIDPNCWALCLVEFNEHFKLDAWSGPPQGIPLEILRAPGSSAA